MNEPVLILAHRRPEDLKRCVEAIRNAGAKNIYASVDGPTNANDLRNEEVKKILLDLGSDLINHQFLPENLGCKAGVEAGIDWFFSKVDQGVIIEEDVLISPSGLKFLAAGLKALKPNGDVFMVGAHLPTGSWRSDDKPIASALGTIWGWATWSDRWQIHRSEFPKLDMAQKRSLIRNTFSNTLVAKSLTSAIDLIFDGKLDTWDFQWNISLLKNRAVCILPPINQVQNIGIGEKALHTTALHSGVSNQIGSALSEIEFELPPLPDLSFETEWFRRLKGRKHLERTDTDQNILSSFHRSNRLNLLSINTTDLGGGAEKIFLRGITSSYSELNTSGLVKVKKTDHPSIMELPPGDRFRFPFSRSRTLAENLEKIAPQPDLIHIHNLHDTDIGLKEILSLANQIPMVWTLHDQWLLGNNQQHPFSSAPPFPKLNKKIFAHSSIKFVAPSIWLQDLVFEKTGTLPFLIRHGIDTAVFKPQDRTECCKLLGLDLEKKRLLFIANNPRENPYKDFETLKAAWKNVNIQVSEPFDLICLGAREDEIETIGQAQIHFIPFQSDETTVANYLNACDCLVHATKSDVSSLSILEAFACKTPVIASAVDGIPELLLGERNGRLFSSSNVEDLSKAMLDLQQKRAETHRMVENAHRYVRETHPYQDANSAYLGLYSKLSN